MNDKIQNSLTDNFNQLINTVQSTAETAINATNEAYAESDSELRNIIDALKPFMLYGAIASIFYFVFRKGK